MTDRLVKTLRGDGRAIEAASRRAAERLTATLAGDADVAYAEMDSPVGPLLLAATRRGLVRVQWLAGDEDAILQQLADRLGPRVLHAPARLEDARRELEEYFAGRRTRFEVPVDYTLTRGFTTKVLRATARIPFGSVSTYTDVARRAGSPRASRAAGNALGANPIPIVVPCHRVLHKDGGLGGYGGGLDRKRTLLAIEGVR
jgi:methylated-DNA-[protein]-cysteine S-methyltransferase